MQSKRVHGTIGAVCVAAVFLMGTLAQAARQPKGEFTGSSAKVDEPAAKGAGKSDTGAAKTAPTKTRVPKTKPEPAATAPAAVSPAPSAATGTGAGGGTEAARLFKRAEELLSVGESERGVKMMETVLDQYPNDPARFLVFLALGRHYHRAHDQAKAIEWLRNVEKLKTPDTEPQGEDLDIYVEAMYLTGVCSFEIRQYDKAFSILRRITSRYPNTVWANQAYYYIGMSHFAQEHWNKAIEALSMVGTFIDPNSPVVEFVEAGHRFHVKIDDADLPLVAKMGKAVKVEAVTQAGDKEMILCSPLVGKPDVYVGSLNTLAGAPKPQDGQLEVVGGDKITVNYVDDNTKDGTKDVPRIKTVSVVSSASLAFTLGTYEQKAVAAFMGQPVFLRVRDVDLDKTGGTDVLTVRLTATYKNEEVEDEFTPTAAVDIQKLLAEDKKPANLVRDEVTVSLVETGQPPVHSGIFVGNVPVRRAAEGQPINTTDQILECAIGDEIVASYLDERNANGDVPVEMTAKVPVSGELNTRPMAELDVVADAVLKAKKEIVEAEAYLELARIFKGMGLRKTAVAKAEEGLDRVKFTIQTATPIPPSLKEKGFKLMWDLYIAQDEYGKAMAVCETFNRLYPESPLVSDALMGIARILQEKGEVDQALTVLRKVLALPHSFAKAEAQYRIAEITEEQTAARATSGRGGGKKGAAAAVKAPLSEAAVREYKLCADRYPDSEFAGLALGKVIDYHIDTKDYAMADDLLNQIFMDYQDAQFLDAMLMKWVIVAYRMGNLEKAREKASQLIFEYPGSKYAKPARDTLRKIGGTGTGGESESKDTGEGA